MTRQGIWAMVCVGVAILVLMIGYRMYRNHQIYRVLSGRANAEAVCAGRHSWMAEANRIALRSGSYLEIPVQSPTREATGETLIVPRYRLAACIRAHRKALFEQAATEVTEDLERVRERSDASFDVQLQVYLRDRYDPFGRFVESWQDTVQVSESSAREVVASFEEKEGLLKTLERVVSAAWGSLGAAQQKAEQERLQRLLLGSQEALVQGLCDEVFSTDSFRTRLERACGRIVADAAGNSSIQSCALKEPFASLESWPEPGELQFPVSAEKSDEEKLRDYLVHEIGSQFVPEALLPAQGTTMVSKLRRGFGKAFLAEALIALADAALNRDAVAEEMRQGWRQASSRWLEASASAYRDALTHIYDSTTPTWMDGAIVAVAHDG